MVPSFPPVTMLAVGLVAGFASGVFGVGGGILIVPLLVVAAGFSQHEAHATSLAAIPPIAAAGALAFALHEQIDYVLGALLTVGTLAGAPLGARIMVRSSEGLLRAYFGLLATGVGISLLLP